MLVQSTLVFSCVYISSSRNCVQSMFGGGGVSEKGGYWLAGFVRLHACSVCI